MCMHMCGCVRYRQWKFEFGKCFKSLKKVVFYEHHETLSHRRSSFLKNGQMANWVFYFGSGEATLVQCTLDEKHQRGCGISSASDSTFMHLYYKKCASSSKLTVLSKVLQLQLGICLSGLALVTGWWFFWGGLFLPGGSLWGAVIKEGVFVSSILDFSE